MEDNEKKKTKKKIGILFILLLISFFVFLFLWMNRHNFLKNGNTTRENKEGVVDTILNMRSYEADMEVTIKSNKTTNTYQLKQYYVAPNLTKQIVINPDSIKGLTTIYDGQRLKIENTKLDLNTIYEHDTYLTENVLFLNMFVEDYLEFREESSQKEEKEKIVLTTKTKNEKNQYLIKKTLYLDKKTGKPTKMEVQDVNQNITVYILYNEIKINQTKQEEIQK